MKKLKTMVIKNCVCFIMLFIISLADFLYPNYIDMTKVGEWGVGAYKDVFVHGDYAFCTNTYPGLEIINISNIKNPKKVSDYTLTNAGNLLIRGDYAYIARGENEIHIIDISNKNTPLEVGIYRNIDTIIDFDISGGFSYIATADRLFIVNISNPTNPYIESFRPISGYVGGLYVKDNFVYIARNTGLDIIDVSDPNRPVYIGSYISEDRMFDVFIKDNYAYVTSRKHDHYINKFQLLIIDISNPSFPTLLGSSNYFDCNIFFEIHVSDNFAYVNAGHNGLFIFDVSTASSPKHVSTVETPNYTAGIFLKDNYAYIADYIGGLHIIDISNPSSPLSFSKYDKSEMPNCVEIINGYAYILGLESYDFISYNDRSKLSIINIENPSAPKTVGSYTMAGHPQSLIISGQYAYAFTSKTCNQCAYYDYLYSIDVSNPSTPCLANSIDKTYGPYIQYIIGNYAYEKNNILKQLRIYDISNSFSLNLVGTYNYDSNIDLLYVNGQYAYAATNNIMEIIDISNPSSPLLVGTYTSSKKINKIMSNGIYTFVVTDNAIEIIDKSNPSSPYLLGIYHSTHEIYHLFLTNNYAYTSSSNVLETIDITTPSSPTKVGQYISEESITDFYVKNNHIYIINTYWNDLHNKIARFSILKIEETDSPPKIGLSRNHLYFATENPNIATDPQSIFISNTNVGNLNWKVEVTKDWIKCSPTSGTNSGEIIVSVDSSGLSPGTYNGTINISDPNAFNSPQSVSITLKVFLIGQTSNPFGEFSTPINGSTVRSSVPITGWALDDIGIENVQILREENNSLIYIGDAVFVEGARPDIEQMYTDFPINYKAGWGYMMLTNFLPNSGNGTFNIHAIATDIEGNQVNLGIKTITCDNANAIKPFGAIDAPTQGGVITESPFINWGWVLTPQPNTIPTDGSTIHVWVDGVKIGNPIYNKYRADIAELFPDYNNSNGAAGYFQLDTTSFNNGTHTIHWTATDDAGNTDGIGSRYFSIQNVGLSNNLQSKSFTQNAGHLNNSKWTPQSIEELNADISRPIFYKKGYENKQLNSLYPDKNENFIIEIKELEPLEIHLYEDLLDQKKKSIKIIKSLAGYICINNGIRPLPIGSTLNQNSRIFYWQPGVGFIGDYHLVFVHTSHGKKEIKKKILVRVKPKF